MLNANKQGNNHPSQCTELTYAKPDSNQRSMLPLCYIYAKAQGATTTKIPRVLIITKAIFFFLSHSSKQSTSTFINYCNLDWKTYVTPDRS